MRRCRTVIVIALLGSVPVIAAALVMRLVLPIGHGQAAMQAQLAAPAPVVEEKAELVLVLAAAQFLPAGTLLADEHLAGIGIEEDLVTRGHITVEDLDPDEMPYGYAVREAIEAGAPLVRRSLVGPWQRGFLAAALRPGMRAVTATLGAVTGPARAFGPGDRVDVILTSHSREHGERSLLARRFLEDVRIVAVDRRVGGAASAPGDAAEREQIVTATLEVLPSQTGLLALAELEGELSLAVRRPAAAGEPGEALDMQGRPVLPQNDPQQGSLLHTVRVVRGSAVGDVPFGASAPRPESILEQNGLEAGREIEPLRTRTAEQPDPGGIQGEQLSGGAAPTGEGAPDVTKEFASTLPEVMPAENEPPASVGAKRQHALAAADPGPGGDLVRRLAGGTVSPAAAGRAGAAEDPVGLAAASLPQAGAVENAPDAGLTPEPMPGHSPALDLDVAFEARGLPGAQRTGAVAPAGTAELASSTRTESMPGGSGRPAVSSVEEPRTPWAAEADSGSELVQHLAGGIKLPGTLGSADTAEGPLELAALSLAEAERVESGAAASSDLQPMSEIDPARPAFDTVPGEPASAGALPAGEVGLTTTGAFALPFLSKGAADEHASPLALDPERLNTLPASAPDIAAGNVLLPARGAAPADAVGSTVATELAADLLRNRTVVRRDLATGPKREPSSVDRAERPGTQSIPEETTVLETTAAEQAAEAAIASLPWAMLSANGTVIAGGGALLLGWGGALLWLRRQNRALRERLQAVGAPLTGHGAVEQIAPEESIFRQTRPNSRLSWLWRRIERRYPLIDAPKAFPRLLGVGLLVAAGVWAGMWVLGMSGWWSLPAAALAGYTGGWFALRRIQARMETQFIQQFPEIVDQIVRLSGAGLPPLEALGKVAEDAQQPVKGVLEEVSDALLAGLDADTALGMVAGRVRLAEFTLFAAVIRLQRRAGGSISGAFSNLATTLRERRTTALKAKASTAQTRLTLLVLILMPPLVLGVQSMTSPQSVDLLFNSEDGKTLLQLGVGLIVVGLVVARQIAARGPR